MSILYSRKESFIGQASSNDLRIALHYEDAFNVLYESKKYQDHIVIPALFLVRQFLELGLKYNIKKLSQISKSKNLVDKLSKTHCLTALYGSFVEHYKLAKKEIGFEIIENVKLLQDLKSLVQCISVFDNGSMGYRYSSDKNNKKMIDLGATYNLEEVKKLLENTSVLLTHIEDVFGLTN